MKKLLTIVLSALLLSQTSVALAFYSDVTTENPHYTAIKSLYDQGLLPQEADNLFHPDDLLNKAEFYKLLLTYGKADLVTNFELPYIDVSPESKYATYIKTAFALNMLKVKTLNPEFSPDQTLAKHLVLSTMFDNLGIGTSSFYSKDNYPFTDLSQDSYINPTALKAYEIGILEEDDPSKFRMAKRISKGEAAEYLYKINLYDPLSTITAQPIIKTITVEVPTTNESAVEISNENLQIFADVWNTLIEDYYYKDSLDPQSMLYDALSGLMTNVKDPYTVFQEPSEASGFLGSLSGEVEGIGVTIELIDNNVTVISPLKDSPAETAGIKPNDIIKKVNGTSIADKTLEEVSGMIRGKAGTTVTINILRGTSSLDFTITRAALSIISVDGSIMTNSQNKKVAYISVVSFSDNTYEEFLDIATELKAKNPAGYIIDLRNNPGGFLDVAVEMVSLFTDEIKTATSLKFASSYEERYKTNGNGLLDGAKSVVLINEGSASASEIMAGALQDFGISKIIGTNSFGKDSVQQLMEFSDQSLLKYTIAKWLTPDGTDIGENGITPDKIVKNTGTTDSQLNSALAEF